MEKLKRIKKEWGGRKSRSRSEGGWGVSKRELIINATPTPKSNIKAIFLLKEKKNNNKHRTNW